MTKIKDITINLIAEEESDRARLFKALLGTKAKITKYANYEKEINIFFNFDTFQDDKNRMLSTLVDMDNKEALTILDISKDIDFDDTSIYGSYLIVAVVCAGFVICSNEVLQEEIYDNTGRVAYLIKDPINLEFVKPQAPSQVIDDLKILWYGDIRDVLSVRPDITIDNHNITVACSSFVANTKDRANTILLKNQKDKMAALKEYDVVYLPRTYTTEAELARYTKVQEAVAAGKFVIAPKLEFDIGENMAFNGDLNDGLAYIQSTPKEEMLKELQELQDLLKQRENRQQLKNNLEKALSLAPQDDYTKNLDELLDTGAFPI